MYKKSSEITKARASEVETIKSEILNSQEADADRTVNELDWGVESRTDEIAVQVVGSYRIISIGAVVTKGYALFPRGTSRDTDGR